VVVTVVPLALLGVGVWREGPLRERRALRVFGRRRFVTDDQSRSLA
jgi:hypothetical protein